MIPLVEIPEIVRHYEAFFVSVFSPEAFEQFKRYISGLLVSENKTVEGINQLFVIDVRNQSSLNRFLTESPFSLDKLNRARLAMLSSQPGTQMKPKGVLSLDDTLLEHVGENFDKIAYLWDHVKQHYVWAHNLVNLHYSDDETDFPVNFRLWEPAEIEVLEAGFKAASIPIRQDKYALKESEPKKWRAYLVHLWARHQKNPEMQKLYQTKLLLAQDLLTQVYSEHKDLNLATTFDNWYTQPPLCKFLHKTLKVPYVGTLAGDDRIILPSGEKRLDEFALDLKQKHCEAVEKKGEPVFRKITIDYKGKKETYYSYCRNHRIKNFGKQRLVINHREADLSDAGAFFISNKLNWSSVGITRIRRHRWPVEVYHEEGKDEGLDQYQVRDFGAINKHIALVAVTYSLLKVAQHDKALIHKLQRTVKDTLAGSLGYWRRNTQAQALWALATFISTGIFQGKPLSKVMAPLLAAFSQ